MCPQSWSISDKRSRGSIVRFIWLSTIPNSRHALCGRRFFHAVSPGGNRFRMGNQLLRKQRHEKLAVEPRLSAFIIVLWEMANCAIDLNLLKTSSTGHRSRYHCNTSGAENSVSGNRVMTFPGRDTETNASRTRISIIDRIFNAAFWIYPRSGFSSTPIGRHCQRCNRCRTLLKSLIRTV